MVTNYLHAEPQTHLLCLLLGQLSVDSGKEAQVEKVNKKKVEVRRGELVYTFFVGWTLYSKIQKNPNKVAKYQFGFDISALIIFHEVLVWIEPVEPDFSNSSR